MPSQPRHTRKAKPPAKELGPCMFNCGRPAIGNMLVEFLPFSEDRGDDSWQRHIRISVPSCRECFQAALDIRVTLPERFKPRAVEAVG